MPNRTCRRSEARSIPLLSESLILWSSSSISRLRRPGLRMPRQQLRLPEEAVFVSEARKHAAGERGSPSGLPRRCRRRHRRRERKPRQLLVAASRVGAVNPNPGGRRYDAALVVGGSGVVGGGGTTGQISAVMPLSERSNLSFPALSQGVTHFPRGLFFLSLYYNGSDSMAEHLLLHLCVPTLVTFARTYLVPTSER